jgi:hypothetical protein
MVWIGWMIGSLTVNRQQAKEFAVSPHFFHIFGCGFFAYFLTPTHYSVKCMMIGHHPSSPTTGVQTVRRKRKSLIVNAFADMREHLL